MVSYVQTLLSSHRKGSTILPSPILTDRVGCWSMLEIGEVTKVAGEQLQTGGKEGGERGGGE